MYIPRLLVLLLGVSVGLAAQVSGHVRHVGNVYECVVGPETEQSPWKNPFTEPAFGQHAISLTRIVPPPEFRAHHLTMVDERRVSAFDFDSLLRTLLKPISCQAGYGTGRASFH
jgi:hypothetical protein